MKNRLSPNRAIAITVATLSVCAHTPARASMVDYGSLQELFGESITTSATGTPQRASEVAANMTIITADEIRQSGTRNIPQILARVPGLDILQTGENTFDVGVRGYQQPFQPRLLVLVNGRQVFIDDYSRTNWAEIPVNIDDIRQIEVVKGASSALFGSNAAGGVVNIVTYSSEYDKNNVASVYGGTQSKVGFDATGTAHFGESNGVKLSVGSSNADEFRTDNNRSVDLRQSQPITRYAAGNADFRIAPNLEANSELTIAMSHDNSVSPSYYTNMQDMTTYSAKGGLVWQSPFGQVSNNNYVNHVYSHAVGSNFNTGTVTQLIVSQLEDQFKVGADNSFRAALEFRNKYHRSEAAQVFTQNPAFEQNVYSASGTWLAQLTPQLSWTNAARFDHQEMAQTGTLFTDAFESNASYSHVINTYSLNSGLVYKPTDLDTFRATYGRGTQLPSFFQEGLVTTIALGGSTFYDLEGNPKLKPTTVENYELGYDRDVPDISSKIKFSVYYEINKDIVGFESSTFNRTVGPNTYIVVQSANVGNSDGFGSEVELKGGTNGFRWDTSYSYSRAADSHGVSSFLNYDGSAPKHHFRLFGGYTTGPWEFDGNLQVLSSTRMMHASSTSAFAPVPVDGYASVGGRIGYNINDNFTIAVSGTNIQNDKVDTSPYPAVERQALIMLTGKF